MSLRAGQPGRARTYESDGCWLGDPDPQVADLGFPFCLNEIEGDPLAGAKETEHRRGVHYLGVDRPLGGPVVRHQLATTGQRVVGLDGGLGQKATFYSLRGHSGPRTAQKDNAPNPARTKRSHN